MFKFGAFGRKNNVSSLIQREEIDLSSGKHSDKSLDELAEVLLSTKVLKKLTLDWNKCTLQSTPFTHALGGNKTLTELSLRGNQIGAEGAGKLAEALKANRVLQRINLEMNEIDHVGAAKIANALKVNQSLQEVDLRKNHFGARGAGKLADALKVNQTLLAINLNNDQIGNEGAGKISLALKVNQTLQRINLRWNQIGNEGAGKLAEALKVNQTLQSIDLGSNQIGVWGAGRLADALKINETLQIMILGNNQIGNDGVSKLADALTVNKTLQMIDLWGNHFGAKGAGKLADALEVNGTLQKIELSRNEIGNVGAGKLADSLMVNQTLQKLKLGSNEIGIEGVRRLLDAIKSNFTLVEMSLDDNGTGNEEIESDVSKIKSILSDPQRKRKASTTGDKLPGTQINQRPDPRTQFFSKLTSMAESNYNVRMELQELLLLISNTLMLKFFYTATSALLRSGALEKGEASNYIIGALQKSTDLCLSEYDIADFKMILDKAKSDGHIDQQDFYLLDNRAELTRIKNDPEILNLMETVKSNTARIKGLEANVVAINNSVNKIRKGLKHKMKVEAAVGFLSATINAISFGVGGNVVDATVKALGSIVDFGDIIHIQTVAADNGALCVQQVETGIEIAADRFADRKLEDALKKGNILTVVSATAVMMNPISVVSEEERFEASGDSAFYKGDFLQAINFYTKAIINNDSSCHLFSKRSAANLKLGSPENALLDANNAIKLNHKYCKGYHRKGTSLHMLGQFEEAETAFLDGLKIAPNNSALQKALDCLRQDEGYKAELESKFENRGICSLDKGNFADAIESFSKAIELNGSSHLHFSRRSAAYLKMGEPENAFADAVSVVKLSPNIAVGYCLKGKALHALKKLDEAISSFEEGIQKSPEDVELQRGWRLVKADIMESKKKDPSGEHIVDVIKEENIHLGHRMQREGSAASDAKITAPSIDDQRSSQSESFEIGEVERWLLSRLPRLNKDDLINYSKFLADDGFYSVDMLNNELEEDDLGFMKKAHKRAVARMLNDSNHQ